MYPMPRILNALNRLEILEHFVDGVGKGADSIPKRNAG